MKTKKRKMVALVMAIFMCISFSTTVFAANSDTALLIAYGVPEETLEAMPVDVQQQIAQALRDDPSKVSISTADLYVDEDGEVFENYADYIKNLPANARTNATRDLPLLTYTLVAVDGSGVAGNEPVHYTINISYTWNSAYTGYSYEDMIAVSWGGGLTCSARAGISRYYTRSGFSWGSSVATFPMQLNSTYSGSGHFAVYFPQQYGGGINKTGNLNFVLSSDTAQGKTTSVISRYGWHQVTANSIGITYGNPGVNFNDTFIQSSSSQGNATISY